MDLLRSSHFGGFPSSPSFKPTPEWSCSSATKHIHIPNQPIHEPKSACFLLHQLAIQDSKYGHTWAEEKALVQQGRGHEVWATCLCNLLMPSSACAQYHIYHFRHRKAGPSWSYDLVDLIKSSSWWEIPDAWSFNVLWSSVSSALTTSTTLGAFSLKAV